MRVRVNPGGTLRGEPRVPGDKSIAHRWLILAATARGRSRLVGLPASLDVRSTAACLALVSERGRPALEAWARNGAAPTEGHGSTWNDDDPERAAITLEVEGEGRSALTEPVDRLDCGNSGTTMRLIAGTLAAAPFRSVLVGDASLTVAAHGAGGGSAQGDGSDRHHHRRPRACGDRRRVALRHLVRPAHPHRPGEGRGPPGRHRSRGGDVGHRTGRDPRPHRAGARRPGRARVRRGDDGHTAGCVPTRCVRRRGARRRVVRRVPRGRGRADRIGADRPRRRPQPEPAPLPGGHAPDGRARRRPARRGRSSASRSATCGSVRVRSSRARRSPPRSSRS